jgi:hypothetical protein
MVGARSTATPTRRSEARTARALWNARSGHVGGPWVEKTHAAVTRAYANRRRIRFPPIGLQ